MTAEYDAFISHRTADDALAVKLEQYLSALKSEDRNIRVWIDNSNLEKTGSFVGQINDALERSRFVLLLMTPAYFERGSGWTNAEWASALAPDPMNRAQRIIPVLADNCPYIPALISHLDYIDIRGKEYKSGLKEIARIITGAAPNRSRTAASELVGVRIQGDDISEELRLNLLKVEALPRYVYIAPLLPLTNGKHPTKKEIVEMLIEDIGVVPAFRVASKNLISFHDPRLDEFGLCALVDLEGTIGVLTESYAMNEERIVISLLNMELSRQLKNFHVSEDRHKIHRYYFQPKPGPEERKVSWNAGHRAAERTVVKSLLAVDGSIDSWLHQSAYLSFITIDGDYYLGIRPTWILSSDGYEIRTGPTIGKVISKWTNAERNKSVFYHLHFWAGFLAREQPAPKVFSIACGRQLCVVRRNLCAVEISAGISWDYREPSDSLEEAASEIEESFGILPGMEGTYL